MHSSVRASIHCHRFAATSPAFTTLCFRPKERQHSVRGAHTRQLVRCARRSVAASATHMSTSATSQSDVQTADLPAEDLVQYVVLRKDLWTDKQWPLGSVVAQGCHASTAALWLSRDSQATKAYCAPDKLDSMHKVCSRTSCFLGKHASKAVRQA